KYLYNATISVTVALIYFYYTLSQLAFSQQAPKSQKKQLLKKARHNQKRIKLWADHAPMNHLNVK
ncbi:MAG: hypothetical protein WBN66_06250, partial [Smithella sp.]